MRSTAQAARCRAAFLLCAVALTTAIASLLSRADGAAPDGAPQVVLFHLTAETIADASVQGTVFANRLTWQCRKGRCDSSIAGQGPFADLCTALATADGYTSASVTERPLDQAAPRSCH